MNVQESAEGGQHDEERKEEKRRTCGIVSRRRILHVTGHERLRRSVFKMSVALSGVFNRAAPIPPFILRKEEQDETTTRQTDRQSVSGLFLCPEKTDCQVSLRIDISNRKHGRFSRKCSLARTPVLTTQWPIRQSPVQTFSRIDPRLSSSVGPPSLPFFLYQQYQALD